MASPLSQQIFPKVVVSRAQFDSVVEIRAYRIWQSCEYRRKQRNWLEAQHELGFWDHVRPDDPRYHIVENYAKDVIYPRHKDADALADWLQAESEVRERYEVSG